MTSERGFGCNGTVGQYICLPLFQRQVTVQVSCKAVACMIRVAASAQDRFIIAKSLAKQAGT